MADVVVSEFVTLDGVFEDPGGAEKLDQGGWAFRSDRGPEGDKFKFEELMSADAMLLGRVTYEGFAAAWPSRTDEAGFAERMNGMPKYVVSSTLERAEWSNSTVIRDDVADAVKRLKAEISGDILVAGSGKLVQALFEHDLVDRLRLVVFPVLLGSGRRLFADGGGPSSLALVDCRQSAECALMVFEAARG
jgi:dihydrofolate reductase